MADLGDREVDPARLRQVLEDDLLRDKIMDLLEAEGTVELVPEGSLKVEEPEDELLEAAAEAVAEVKTAAPETGVIDVEATVVVEAEPCDRT